MAESPAPSSVAITCEKTPRTTPTLPRRRSVKFKGVNAIDASAQWMAFALNNRSSNDLQLLQTKPLGNEVYEFSYVIGQQQQRQ